MCTGPLIGYGSSGDSARALPTFDFAGQVSVAACASLQSAPGSLKNGTFGRRIAGSTTRALVMSASPARWVTIAWNGGWSN